MMIRRSTLIWSALAVGVGIALHFVKHEVHDLEERLSAVDRDIAQHRETIRVLQAEWAYLNRPERLEELGGRLLNLEPVSSEQVITLGGLERMTGEAAIARLNGREEAAMGAKGTGWIKAIMADLEKER